jgi:YHS domain-containing protein
MRKTVEQLQSITATYHGVEFPFCSLQCKQQFENEPEAYIKAAQQQGKPLPLDWSPTDDRLYAISGQTNTGRERRANE